MSIKELQNLISPKFNENVVLDMVKRYYPDLKDVSIKEIKIATVSAKGDSYLSVVCRLCVEVIGTMADGKSSEKSVPVIVKSLPKNLGRRKTFRSIDFFENEIIFYQQVWTALDNFQTKKQIDNPFKSIPLLLAAHIDKENDFIALEDLSYKKYGQVRRASGLDYQHTCLILKLFARLHGLCLAFKDQEPEAFEKAACALKETYFAEKYRKWYSNFQQRLCNITRDAVAKELPEKYLQKVEQLFNKDFFGMLCKQSEVRGPFSVITHGDAWLPNFLIKYGDDNVPLDVTMIDFQLTRYTTLSNDLTFFLYVCTENELREKHWDDLIKYYHESVCETLSNLGSDPKIITLEALQADISKSGFFGIGMAIEAVVMSLLDENQVADLDKIEGEDEVALESVWIVKPFQSPEKRKRLADTIKHAVDRAFI